MRTPPRLLIIFTAATLLVVAAIVSLITGWWWLLPVVLIVHLAVFTGVMVPVGKALRQGDKPDPVTDARLEEEGKEGSLGLYGVDDGQGGADRGTTP